MPTRREFVGTGFAALMIGLLRRKGFALPPDGPPDSFIPPGPLAASRPFYKVPQFPESVLVQGMPFAPGFLGDPFPQEQIPFHIQENQFPGGQPPAPTESVDVAIVGGGLSGLAAAWFLRERRPVVFELHPRFGGVSQGEIWSNTHYSQGGAYFIAPDKGSFLEGLYTELGLDDVYRLSPGGDDPAELNGAIIDDFWSGKELPPEEAKAFALYAKAVQYFVENYPEIPFDDSADNRWIIELDNKTFKQDVEERIGMAAPPLLSAAIQSYFYSSFNGGWEEISAASGWNFIAAEEFGRWVCPGGNAWVTDKLWKKLVKAYASPPHLGAHNPHPNALHRLRPGTRAVDVRMAGDQVLVSYKDPNGAYRSLLANRVVMACSKHICKYLVQDLAAINPELLDALQSVITNPYIVANVLLTAPVAKDFYDAFLLGDGIYPTNQAEASVFWKVTDVISADFSDPLPAAKSVLTLYWPLPWSKGVFEIIGANTWNDITQKIVPQVQAILKLLDVPEAAVRQVRLTRWGHAMPIAYPGFIAGGVPQAIRRGHADRILFANQDNWALPAFETCLLEAKYIADRIEELG